MTIQAKFELSHPGFCLDVDLDLPGQGVTVLFGPSGCGKTSLLRCMAGLNRAGVGRLIVNGETWQDGEFFLPVHRRALGYVFQEANLFAHLTIRRNLEYGQSRIAAAARRQIRTARIWSRRDSRRWRSARRRAGSAGVEGTARPQRGSRHR